MRLLFFLFILSMTIYPQQQNFPEWAKGIVWYQIFPERFANGDESNDPTPDKVFINQISIPEGWQITPWTSDWYNQQEWEKKLGGKFSNHLTSRRYGGDLQGIFNNLDYLENLGVKGIYLNPIFEAVSMHKYDGSTFHHIDVNFGPDPIGDKWLISKEVPDDPTTWSWTSADLLFLRLINEIHSRGMFIIIDGVFNHTGVQFWAFQDIVANGINSQYKNWFLIKDFDNPQTEKNEFDYKGWWNHKSLPEFNRTEDNLIDPVKRYIFDATRRWMDPIGNGKYQKGIDGWRLDVARDVPLGFWREWSKYVKSINPNALIVGELWEVSPDFISENGVFDALMNYPFAYPVINLFIDKKNQISISEFVQLLQKVDKNYPEENLHLLQNLLSSHDTERLTSMIVNPDRQYDRDSDERNSEYNPGKPKPEDYKIQKLIAAFQMTYRGAPMIFYGDEVGMWGPDDPHCRKPMIWDNLSYEAETITASSGFSKGLGTYEVEVNDELLDFYKKMIKLRNENPELKTGEVEFFNIDDNKKLFAMKRFIPGAKELLIIAFNLGKQEQSVSFSNPGEAKYLLDIFNNDKLSIKGNSVTLVVPPLGFRIIKL